MKKLTPQQIAGRASAKKVPSETRKENSRKGAFKTNHGSKPKATHTGTIEIGDFKIPCAVLEDGTRILSETGISDAFGGRPGGAQAKKKKAKESGGALLPVFLGSQNLNRFISNDLSHALFFPIKYTKKMQVFSGYPAELLPQICDVYLKARDAGALHASQASRAFKADLLMRGLAHVGIIALVDSASGYDEVRDKKALEQILDKFLNKEFAAWAKRFPDEFYKEIFRLRGWQWKGMKVQKPSCVGMYTEDLVYKRLGSGVLDELKKLNPKSEKGHRKVRHHQFLTDEFGHPALSQHIHGLILLMKTSNSWESLMDKINTVLPRKGQFFDL
jgi:hypothetical protein